MPSTHETFTFDKVTVFFKHTDYHGFVHPYNYYEWMSYAREAYFQTLVPNFDDVCNRSIKMVTTEAELQTFSEAKFGDSVVIKIYAENVKRLSFEVVFDFYIPNQTQIAHGRQRLTFIDIEAERPTKIPEELKAPILRYERKLV